MSIKIVISDRVKFQVAGSLKDADGADEPFQFNLVCKRLDADQLKLLRNGGRTVTDVMQEITLDWSGVLGVYGIEEPYTKDSLAQLLRIPGLATLVLSTYVDEVSAKAKN